jgi:hypothetical protein
VTRQTSILISFLIFSGCANNDSIGKFSQKKDTLKTIIPKQIAVVPLGDTAFKLDFFDAIPDTINGCGEYFTHDTSNVTKDRYIFLSNLTEFAIIKINGKDIYLKRYSIESKEINDKSYIAVYKGQDYKAVLTIKQAKTYDEGGFYSGTLQIIGDKINATFKVHGEAGC